MDKFMKAISDRLPPDNVLCRLEGVIDWRHVVRKTSRIRSKLKRTGYDVDLMIRVLLPDPRAFAVRQGAGIRYSGAPGLHPFLRCGGTGEQPGPRDDSPVPQCAGETEPEPGDPEGGQPPAGGAYRLTGVNASVSDVDATLTEIAADPERPAGEVAGQPDIGSNHRSVTKS